VEVTLLECEGALYIPHRIREAAGLKEGDVIEVDITSEGILLRPRRAMKSVRAWAGARDRLAELQEKAVREQAAKGDRVFYTDEEFLDALAAIAAEDADV
jgi:AbrB family looped-hinge helix DNA binding protein